MATKPNDVEEDTTLERTSVQLPPWMRRRLREMAARTFSSEAQVIRRLIGEGLEREPAERSEVAS